MPYTARLIRIRCAGFAAGTAFAPRVLDKSTEKAIVLGVRFYAMGRRHADPEPEGCESLGVKATGGRR